MLCVERVCCKASVMPLIYIADFSSYMFGTVPKSNVVWQPQMNMQKQSRLAISLKGTLREKQLGYALKGPTKQSSLAILYPGNLISMHVSRCYCCSCGKHGLATLYTACTRQVRLADSL